MKLLAHRLHVKAITTRASGASDYLIFEILCLLCHFQAGQQLNITLGTRTTALECYALMFACRAILRPIGYERCSRIFFIVLAALSNLAARIFIGLHICLAAFTDVKVRHLVGS